MDWAGLALERATKTRLNDYMQKNIFQPLGLEDINMFPTASMKKRLVNLHQRGTDEKLSIRDHLHRRALAVKSQEAKDLIFHSGGAGLFATPKDYGSMFSMYPLRHPRLNSVSADILRNHHRPPQQRHMPPHRGDDPKQGHCRPDVHEPNPRASGIWPPGTSGGQACARQSDPSALSQWWWATRLGAQLHDNGRHDRAVRGNSLVDWAGECVLVG